MLERATKAELIDSLPLILSVPEVADFLAVSHRTVSRMIRDGQIVAFRDEEEWQILRDDLLSYLSHHSSL